MYTNYITQINHIFWSKLIFFNAHVSVMSVLRDFQYCSLTCVKELPLLMVLNNEHNKYTKISNTAPSLQLNGTL